MGESATRMHAAVALLTVPTLLVRGALSGLVSGGSVADLLEAVPHARFVDVGGAGHMAVGAGYRTVIGHRAKRAPEMGENVTVAELVTEIECNGYAIREGVLGPVEVAALRAALDPILDETPTGRNPFEGFRTRRVYSPLAKTRALDELILSPWLEQLSTALLGPHTLSSIIGIEIGPGEVAQEIHYDAAAYPLPRNHGEVVLNTMWALDDFTADNGATVLYPGSHLHPERTPPADVAPIQAVMPAGSVLFWPGRTFHGGGANHTDRSRFGVVIEFVAGWLRTHENIQASIPTSLARELPERLQELIGYHLYPDFLGYVDGRHPRKVLIHPAG